jgi:hypothetical protein
MSKLLSKASRIHQEEGLTQVARRAVQFGFDEFVRPLLPRRVVSYNGISVRASHVGDGIIPWQTTNIPDYEEALIRGIDQYVAHGDTVVIVGGGWGVSSVEAAEKAGESGKVIIFEGSEDAVESVNDTIRLNDVADQVLVRHAIVARAISLRGSKGDAEVVAPTELPDCDVLILDCEGAEIDILSEMLIRPEAVIVETHGMFDASSYKVRSILTENGYKISSKDIAEERNRVTCIKYDIYILAACLL